MRTKRARAGEKVEAAEDLLPSSLPPSTSRCAPKRLLRRVRFCSLCPRRLSRRVWAAGPCGPPQAYQEREERGGGMDGLTQEEDHARNLDGGDGGDGNGGDFEVVIVLAAAAVAALAVCDWLH